MNHAGTQAADRRSRTLVISVAVFVCAALLASTAASALSLRLPTGVSKALAYRIYAEQLDSQESIGLLVAGKISSFDVVSRSVSATSATLGVRVRFVDGTSRRGVFKMKRAGGKWYLASVRRTTTAVDDVPSVTSPDVGVLNTILSEQSIHVSVIDKLVRGTYTQVTVGKPVAGYRSRVLPIYLKGPGISTKGGITCVKRFEPGKTLWFVASFWQ